MTEKASERLRISLSKTASSSDATNPPARPKQATWLIAALLLSGGFAVAGSLSLYGLHAFLLKSLTTANKRLKKSDQQTPAELVRAVSHVPTSNLIQSVVFLVALVFVANAVRRGRYWARMAVYGLAVLTVFTRVLGSPLNVTYLLQSVPVALKVPVALSALSMIAAVGLSVASKPLGTWLNLTRPERRTAGGSAIPTRRGMFTPREPIRPSAPTAAASSPGAAERGRSKQRTGSESAAAPASAPAPDARARASKSRRSGS